jgi:anti-sigma B factor antagonist
MFSVTTDSNGEVLLTGRLDASATDDAAEAFAKITSSTRMNFKDLEYISSAGLGVLFATQKRLKAAGHALTLTNMNPHVRDVFKYARFDLIFTIE